MKRLLALVAAGIMLAMTHAPTAAEPAGAFDHGFQAIEGGRMPLAQWRGKVLLVANTASFCGYTRQYEGLQGLWERYREKGLVVIGVPSNDFGAQEPKAESEIQAFCQGAFGVTFPLTTKEVVKGGAAHPFYRWAGAALGAANAPRWNFHKYLVDRKGEKVLAYDTKVTPNDPKLVKEIERLLAD